MAVYIISRVLNLNSHACTASIFIHRAVSATMILYINPLFSYLLTLRRLNLYLLPFTVSCHCALTEVFVRSIMSNELMCSVWQLKVPQCLSPSSSTTTLNLKYTEWIGLPLQDPSFLTCIIFVQSFINITIIKSSEIKIWDINFDTYLWFC